MNSARQYVMDERGRRTAVILPIREYEQLLEDLHDLVVAVERRDDPLISHEEMERRLARGG